MNARLRFAGRDACSASRTRQRLCASLILVSTLFFLTNSFIRNYFGAVKPPDVFINDLAHVLVALAVRGSLVPGRMDNTAPRSAFEHDPLPNSTTHFRLLYITHGDYERPVRCELSAWPIETAPPYYAISYTWGDPTARTEITINGRPLSVTQNCVYVLQQAFASEQSDYYWVDAICIAQEIEQERGCQVGIMGQIYSRAQHVFACVGPHANDSEYLAHILDQWRSLLDAIDRLSRTDSSTSDRIYLSPKARWRIYRLLSTSEPRLEKAFSFFMRRPYFTRVWILQELRLASKVSYCFGTLIRSNHTLLALQMVFMSRPLISPGDDKPSFVPTEAMPFWKGTIKYKLLPRSDESLTRLDDSGNGCLALASEAPVLQDLADILRVIANFRCADPRDRLYAMLSVVDWSDMPRPNPDYSKDNFEVATLALNCLSDKAFRSESALYWAHSVLLLFEVTVAAASLLRAIENRQRAFEEALEPSCDGLGLKHIADSWWAIKIRHYHDYHKGRSEDGRVLWISPRERSGNFVKLRNDLGSVAGYAPHNTKIGDWYVFQVFDRMALVVRASHEGLYSIVGPTLTPIGVRSYHHEGALGPRFTAHWQPLDLLTLAWRFTQLPVYKDPHDQVSEFVNTRICVCKNSSWFVKNEESPQSTTTDVANGKQRTMDTPSSTNIAVEPSWKWHWVRRPHGVRPMIHPGDDSSGNADGTAPGA